MGKLLEGEYDLLTLEERVEAMLDLVHLALDMPATRAALDKRIEDVERAKKQLRDEAKVEKRKQSLAMAARAKADAEATAAKVKALREQMAADGTKS